MRNGIKLTYVSIRIKWFVVKAEKLSEIVEVRMLSDQIPLCVIHVVVKVCDCDLHSPVLFVVSFYMPMNSDGTHMLCTLQERFEVVLPNRRWYHRSYFMAVTRK